MADITISDLPAKTSLLDSDLVPIDDGVQSYRVTGAQLREFLKVNFLSVGTVVLSQSSLATDNPGRLPLWTGEYIASASTLYPDFYKWVKEKHPELCRTKEQYDAALTQFGECPFYVVDEENGSLRLPKKSLSHGIVVKEKKPTDLDPTWYRQWSDGWLEQGGVTGAVTGGQSITTTLLKEYANKNYTVIAQGLGTYTASGEANCPITLKNTTSFSLTSGFNGSKTFNWYACGQGTEGAQDETLYPWVFAYNATVPASTAQAAAFQESVSSLNEFKANKDLANVDKSLLISYGTPDFTARIDNSVNTEYTAERAGILIGKLGAGGDHGSAVLTIDGLDFPLQSNGETWGSYQFPFCIPVGQGSVYKLTASCYVSAFYFIPLKGAL